MKAIAGRAAPGLGFTKHHVVLTDELLDELALRYCQFQIRGLTGARFEEYVARPRDLEAHAVRLAAVGARQDGRKKLIVILSDVGESESAAVLH